MHRSSLWMPDGNIILSALQIDSTSPVLFKVHKSVLARHSTFFADLFSLPSEPIIAGAGVDDTYQGLPIVPLHDPAEEVEALLRAAYDPTSRLLPKERYLETIPPEGRQLYSLSDKYGFEAFMTRIKDHTVQGRPRSSSA